MKTIAKKLEPGRWRIKMGGKQDVVDVRLNGLRKRQISLHKWNKEDFYSHIPQQEMVVLRGVPTAWLQDGPYLMLWPAPAHEWELEYDTVERT